MHTLQRAPQRLPPSRLCLQCRHATTKSVQKKKNNVLALKKIGQELRERSSLLRTRVHAARRARREDWTLGPLAPDRFAAADDHGCVTIRELNGVSGLEKTRQGRSPYMPPEMRWEESLIREGDRVAVVAEKGPASRERGKVGRVLEVHKKAGECIVEDLNMVDIKAPPYVQQVEPNSPPIRTVPMPLPLSAVRLVYPLKVPEQKDALGNTTREAYYQDTIISQLVTLPGRKGRYIANSERALGQWVEIPKNPNAAPNEPAPSKDHDVDTLRYQVEERTWTPTLLRAPMPAGVLDELRGKYSRYRTRHEEGYQRALDNRRARKAEYKAWAKSGGGMLTSPLKEARAREVHRLKNGEQPELKEEILERIGEVMAGKGIEVTEGRMKEVERNLEREEVLRGSRRGDGGGEGEEEVDSEEVEEVEGELEREMDRLGVDEMVIEDRREHSRDEHRP